MKSRDVEKFIKRGLQALSAFEKTGNRVAFRAFNDEMRACERDKINNEKRVKE